MGGSAPNARTGITPRPLLFAILAALALTAPAAAQTVRVVGAGQVTFSDAPDVQVGNPVSFEYAYDAAAPDMNPDPNVGL